jgi:hypothetical protein
MIAGIHQPNYIPWSGYFYKIAKSDVFIFLDNVPYTKNSFINRNKIKTQHGEAWMTISVLTKGRYGQMINEVKINNNVPWGKIHWKTIEANYAKAPYFKEYKHLFEDIYQKNWEKLIELNEALIKLICDILCIKNIKFIRASELGVSGRNTELLINICKATGADSYFSGSGGKKYMEEESFEKEGVKLKYSEFQHPTYDQLWGNFSPNLSVIDLIFNKGGSNFE